MAKMGAPGVRIELKDSSQYTVIENPNAVAAIVGFAPQGELNKVTKLTNTAVADTTFGIGFNNWKYNQGLYAARAVLTGGGHVQYVRPYGEEIDKSDPRKRDLKTDAFIVSFDRAVGDPNNANKNSLDIKYFAATRFKSDGASNYGVTRKINNIAETVSSGSNVDFKVFADEGFGDSFDPNNPRVNSARSKTDNVLFGILAADPSSARRALESYDVLSYDSLNDGDPDTFRVILSTNPGFTVGDIVYGPADTRTNTFCYFMVTGMDGKQVDITAADDKTKAACLAGYKPSTTLMFSPNESVADSDADYLTIKTAVTGRGAKLFTSLRINSENIAKMAGGEGSTIFNGMLFNVIDQSNNAVSIRVANGNYTTISNPFASISDVSDPIDLGVVPGLVNGDSITLEWEYGDTDPKATHSGTFLVSVTEGEDESMKATAYLTESAWLAKDLADKSKFGSDVTVRNMTSGWSDEIDYVPFTVPTKGDDETDLDYVERFRTALLAAFRSSRLGYGSNVVTNDIAMEAKDFTKGVTKVLTMTPGSVFDYNVGDHVAIVRGTISNVGVGTADDEPAEIEGSSILMMSKVAEINGYTNTVTLVDAINADFYSTVIVEEEGTKSFNPNYTTLQLLNLESTNKSTYAAMASNTIEVYEEIEIEVSGTPREMYITGGEGLEGKKVTYVVDGETIESVVLEGTRVSSSSDYIYQIRGTAPIGEITEARLFTGEEKSSNTLDIYLIGNYDVTVNSSVQKVTDPVVLDDIFASKDGDTIFTYQASGVDTAVVWQSEKVLRNSEIGANFVGLGLANIKYEDINFTGVTEKVYDLTEAGESVARLYMSCVYRFNGKTYEFDGTVVEYVHNETQLFIGDTAEAELTGTGCKFLLNESGILDAFLDDEAWDLSETVVEDEKGRVVPSASMTQVAFNADDPAVQWDAIWTYEPYNNNSTATLATAYNLFLDKDKSDQTFFVAAGTTVNNFGWTGRETLNSTVINAILNICELRKDCFALCDAPAEQNIEVALKKDTVRFPSTLGRWGALYDARPRFYDGLITRRNVECAPSVAMANLITANRSGSIFWYVPAGKDTGVVPSAWCSSVKYERKFNIPEDSDSDIARLCDAHVNPFRTNDEGIFCWGDFTMQMEDSAFNQIHVAMLIAGIHKMFYKYLDGKVFRLNTAALRSQISSDLQAKLNMIRDSNPSGFYDAVAICDETNNTPEVIDQNKLYVDLKLKPTKSTRYIYLRTEVLATSSGNSITFSEVGR